jgi:hypothetical protein
MTASVTTADAAAGAAAGTMLSPQQAVIARIRRRYYQEGLPRDAEEAEHAAANIK